MTGIAALAAAAAATQKIPGTIQTHTATQPTAGIKVVTPTIVTPQGVKVTPVTRQIGESNFPYFQTQINMIRRVFFVFYERAGCEN